MADPERFDVVVIGAGLAGLTAANRAAELGLSCAVLERGAGEIYLCNSRFTGGFFHIAFNDVTAPVDRLVEAINTTTDGFARPDLAEALATDCRRAVAWLREQGVRFVRGGPEDWMSHVLAPPGLRRPGLHWQGRAGDVMLRRLGERLSERGVPLVRGARAVELVERDGACRGVVAQTAGGSVEYYSRAVVIADGGFQGDPEQVRESISPAPERVLQRGAGTGAGDGIRLARALGAQTVGLDRFYGHVQHRDAMTSEGLWPYPILDLVCAAGIAVDGEGRRFADEGLGGVYLANAIAALPNPLSAVVVFDEDIWQGAGREFVLPPNPTLETAGGAVAQADGLAALADKVGLPAETLVATVEAYNRAVGAGGLSDAAPPRSTHRYPARPIATPPFRAAPVCAGLTYTMGGLAIDGWGRVLGAGNAAIPGLFAAGSATGGLEGGPVAGYTGGLSKAATFGLRAAEEVHRQIG